MYLRNQILQFLFSGLTTGSIYSLIAIGFSIVHNSRGIVNFAQGEFVMLGGMTMIGFHNFLRLPLALSFVFSVSSVALIGALLEWGPLRNSRSKATILLVMITIGASIVMKALSMMIWGKNSMGLPPFSGEAPYTLLGATILPQSLWVMGITLASVTLLHIFFTKTILGKAIRASAVNRKVAALMGISVTRTTLFSFLLSGTLGAIAGIIITPITTTSYDVGIILGLKGFSAAILGGYGNMLGSLIGGLLLGVLESLGAGLISSRYKDAFAFGILLIVLFLKPSGLLGRGETERV